MQIASLHHISQETGSSFDELQQIKLFCEGGGKCTQLRLKTKSEEEMLVLANSAREITTKYGAQLIINDHIELAKEVDANGVHLGQGDRSTTEARSILGEGAIIGRTCNTLEEIIEACENRIDYVGVGPLRFTSTKEVLSPTLGFSGFKNIVEGLEMAGLSIPIIAIGGIQIADFKQLKDSGIHGVAIASLINGSSNIKAQSEKIISTLNKC